MSNDISTIQTVCKLHVNGCAIAVDVSGGVLGKVVPGDFPDPADKCMCVMGTATPEMVYGPDRLRYPLKRVGERGQGQWERISWGEAFDGIAARLQEIARKYGSTSVALGAPPRLNSLAHGIYWRLASLTKSSWVSWMGFGDAAGPCADMATYGGPLGLGGMAIDKVFLSLVDNPKVCIMWGCNPGVTDYYWMRTILDAGKNGAELIVIDPIFTTTAARAHEHIAIRPGSDGALAIGMINVIVERGLQDESFLLENTSASFLIRNDNGMYLRESDVAPGGSRQRFMVLDGKSGQPSPADCPGISPSLTGKCVIAGIECQTTYQLLLNLVRDYPTEKVSRITDIPQDTIERLAVTYATRKPAAIYRGWGMQRYFNSDLACRAINALAAVTGNINLIQPPDFALNWQPFREAGGPCKRMPVMNLYDAVTRGEPWPIKAIWFAGRNFINQLPNVNRITREVFPGLELIIASDLVMTAIARYADYVLPVASFFECADISVIRAFKNTYLALQQKAIDPLYECKTDFEIAVEIGRRLGFAEHFNKSEAQCFEELLDTPVLKEDGVTLEKLRKGPIAAKETGKQMRFGTPTGKIEFYVERLKPLGQELPVYLEPLESSRGAKAKAFPLTLLSTHRRNGMHSQMAKVPSLLKTDPEPKLQINPVDASSRDIADGDTVCAYNDRGKARLRARLSRNIKPGVVNITQGWWPDQYIEGHHNELTNEKINLAQQLILEPNAALYDTLVEVTKVHVQDE
ncbi:MAG: molybdopterin-dependent oxidoreductase [Dehalococcoidia bacterium]|nr:molybdopterin-dependent oxidoreductase [Dehalococcoidia bacterium]